MNDHRITVHPHLHLSIRYHLGTLGLVLCDYVSSVYSSNRPTCMAMSTTIQECYPLQHILIYEAWFLSTNCRNVLFRLVLVWIESTVYRPVNVRIASIVHNVAIATNGSLDSSLIHQYLVSSHYLSLSLIGQ